MSAENQSLTLLLRGLRLGAFAESHSEFSAKAEREGWTFTDYLRALSELEFAERHQRRISRNLKASLLPSTKTLATLDISRLPTKVRTQLPALCRGDFLKQATNILAFGLPGRGKTHVCAAIGHALIRLGYKVFFISTYKLVQRLLIAKRNLELERVLKRLDHFDAVILDDIGYIQQDRDEMEVLFTFLAERYERKSVILTSNLVFSQWDRIFKDPMTTAAAIDRLVHHSVILELTGSSMRTEVAQARIHKEKSEVL